VIVNDCETETSSTRCKIFCYQTVSPVNSCSLKVTERVNPCWRTLLPEIVSSLTCCCDLAWSLSRKTLKTVLCQEHYKWSTLLTDPFVKKWTSDHIIVIFVNFSTSHIIQYHSIIAYSMVFRPLNEHHYNHKIIIILSYLFILRCINSCIDFATETGAAIPGIGV